MLELIVKKQNKKWNFLLKHEEAFEFGKQKFQVLIDNDNIQFKQKEEIKFSLNIDSPTEYKGFTFIVPKVESEEQTINLEVYKYSEKPIPSKLEQIVADTTIKQVEEQKETSSKNKDTAGKTSIFQKLKRFINE